MHPLFQGINQTNMKDNTGTEIPAAHADIESKSKRSAEVTTTQLFEPDPRVLKRVIRKVREAL